MYTIQQAKINFSKLLQKAARGEEVILARGKTPVAKLVAIPAPEEKNKKTEKSACRAVGRGGSLTPPMLLRHLRKKSSPSGASNDAGPGCPKPRLVLPLCFWGVE